MSVEKFENHTIEYQHDGSTWDIEVMATSESDAFQRLHMATHGNYIGVCYEAPVAAGFLVKAWCVVANFFRTKK